jgi:hypothetical protein
MYVLIELTLVDLVNIFFQDELEVLERGFASVKTEFSDLDGLRRSDSGIWNEVGHLSLSTP